MTGQCNEVNTQLAIVARRQSYSAKGRYGALAVLLAVVLASATPALGAPADRSREPVIKIVAQIQRADYEGDRAALKRLYGELSQFVDSKELAARVRYWRGFALWRRAINGFNDAVDRKELQDDLKQALDEFNQAINTDPNFVDAKVGALGCMSLIAFTMIQANPAWMQDKDVQELLAKARQLRKEIEAVSPENPRLIWVMGPVIWNTPVDRGGGQDKAMEMYAQGLKTIQKQGTTAIDPLEPSWGGPELLMNLAWSNLNRTTPDVDAAQEYAQSALAQVPYWHYLKDILLPQIQARKKAL